MKPCVIIASGPSLTKEQVDFTRNKECYIIAVNNSVELCPWADLLYSCDARWWTTYKDLWSKFKGEKLTSAYHEFNLDPSIHTIKGRPGVGFSFDPTYIHYGGNSGFQAINIAILKSFKKILLLGFDCGYDKEKQSSHFFGEHKGATLVESPYERWMEYFIRGAHSLALHHDNHDGVISVINCTEGGFLEAFPCSSIFEELK